jgi:patatin-like phospholipase
MSTLPLEVHEVLEEEYVSIYGRLALPPSKSNYTAEQILDESRARRILATCGIAVPTVLEALNALVATDSPAELRKLAELPHISDAAKALLDDYEQHIKEALPERREEINRRIVDDALTGAVRRLGDIRLDNVYTALHKRAKADGKSVGKPRTALCISGGGIRSATFALGVIQGLASARILDKFDYLSTVSGGGYIGSWLSSWIRRHPRGVSGVQEDLQRADTAVASSRPAISDGHVSISAPQDRELPERKIDPEPEPLRHLRAYSNYLSPRLGLFSGDSWTLASLYIRNLLLNLLVLVPLLALALAFPRILSSILQFSAHTGLHRSVWIWIAAGLATLGFAYLGQKRPVEQGEKAQKKARTITTDGSFIVACVLPLTGAAIALSVFWARVQQDDGLLTHPSTLAAVISAVAGMTVVPYFLYYRRIKRSLSAERRVTFITEADFKKKLKSKRGAEAFAMTAALLTAIALLFLLAVKAFDNPLLEVPTVATMAPIDRAGLPALPEAQLYVCFAVPLVLLVFGVQASIFVGLSSHHNEDSDREWWGRAGAWLIAFAVGLALFSAIAVFGPIAFYYAPVILASVGGAAGIVAALLGYSDKTPANQKEKEEGGMTAKAGNLASALTVPLFIAALLAVISLGSTWLIQQFHDEDPKITKKCAQQAVLQAQFTTTEQTEAGVQTLRTTPSPRVSIPALKAVAHLQTIQQTSGLQVLIFLVVALIAVGLSFFIGTNKFSMNALYRNRIIRAYLGASRYGRDPDRFTGFDENDNLGAAAGAAVGDQLPRCERTGQRIEERRSGRSEETRRVPLGQARRPNQSSFSRSTSHTSGMQCSSARK